MNDYFWFVLFLSLSSIPLLPSVKSFFSQYLSNLKHSTKLLPEDPKDLLSVPVFNHEGVKILCLIVFKPFAVTDESYFITMAEELFMSVAMALVARDGVTCLNSISDTIFAILEDKTVLLTLASASDLDKAYSMSLDNFYTLQSELFTGVSTTTFRSLEYWVNP